MCLSTRWDSIQIIYPEQNHPWPRTATGRNTNNHVLNRPLQLWRVLSLHNQAWSNTHTTYVTLTQCNVRCRDLSILCPFPREATSHQVGTSALHYSNSSAYTSRLAFCLVIHRDVFQLSVDQYESPAVLSVLNKLIWMSALTCDLEAADVDQCLFSSAGVVSLSHSLSDSADKEVLLLALKLLPWGISLLNDVCNLFILIQIVDIVA